MREFRGRVGFAVLAVSVLAGCDGDGDGVNGPGEFTVDNYIDGVVNLEQTSEGMLMQTAAPPVSGGPTLSVEVASTVIWGGASRSHLSADAEFTGVVISVVGIDGHYRLDVPATSDLELLLRFRQAIPDTAFDIAYRVITQGGAVSDPVVTTTDVVLVEPGAIQFSVSWDSPADIDLHVVNPYGIEVYWGRTSAGQGSLEVTSNEGCTDGPRAESAVWYGEAPRGNYTVRLGLESLCGAAEASYVVRFRLPGRGDFLYTGTISTTTANGEGEGVEIATRFF